MDHDGHQKTPKQNRTIKLFLLKLLKGIGLSPGSVFRRPHRRSRCTPAPPQLPKSDIEQRPVARGPPAPYVPQPRIERAFRPLVVASEASRTRSQQFPKPGVHNGTNASAPPRPAGGLLKTLCARISAAAGAAHSRQNGFLQTLCVRVSAPAPAAISTAGGSWCGGSVAGAPSAATVSIVSDGGALPVMAASVTSC